MKITRKQIDLVLFAVAGFLVLVSALLAADPVRTSLGLWFGALWLTLAWRFKLPPMLMALLVFMALRGEASMGVPASWMLSVNLGLSAFTLCSFFRTRWAALACAGLWVSMMWSSPLLLVLVLAGFPRFVKLFDEYPKTFFWPGFLFFLGLAGWHFTQGSLTPLMERPFEAATYVEMQQLFLQIFSVESLWRILPLIGLFEAAQKQPDDHRFTWRNLILFAAVLSILFIPVGTALQLLYFVGLPLCGIMLTRWCLALPDVGVRSVYWLGLAGLALPFLQGGLN